MLQPIFSVSQLFDETHRGCPSAGLGASCGTARESRGAVAGAGARVAQCGPGPRSPGSTPDRYAKASKEGQESGCWRGVRSMAGRGQESAHRRPVAADGRPPGRRRPEPGQGAQVLLRLLEGPPAGAGSQRWRQDSSGSPYRRANRWRRGGEISTTGPATNPAVRADSSKSVTVAHCGPVLEARVRARAGEHDPTCSPAGPLPARSAGAADKAHQSRPRTPPWTRSRHPVPGTGASRADRRSPATARRGRPGARDDPPHACHHSLRTLPSRGVNPRS